MSIINKYVCSLECNENFNKWVEKKIQLELFVCWDCNDDDCESENERDEREKNKPTDVWLCGDHKNKNIECEKFSITTC